MAASLLEVAQWLAETIAMVVRGVVTMLGAVRVEVMRTSAPAVLRVHVVSPAIAWDAATVDLGSAKGT